MVIRSTPRGYLKEPSLFIGHWYSRVGSIPKKLEQYPRGESREKIEIMTRQSNSRKEGAFLLYAFFVEIRKFAPDLGAHLQYDAKLLFHERRRLGNCQE